MKFITALVEVLTEAGIQLKRFFVFLLKLGGAVVGCLYLLQLLGPKAWMHVSWPALLPLYPLYLLINRSSNMRRVNRDCCDSALAAVFGASIGLVFCGSFLSAAGLAAGALLALFTLDRAATSEPDGDRLRRRGTKRIALADAQRAARALAAPVEPTLPWGGMEIPASLAKHGFVIFGAQGTGKTSLILILLKRMLELAATNPDARFYLYDAKNTLLQAVRRLGSSLPIRHIHPFAADGLAWDLARDIDSEADADEVASLLFKPEPGGQPFFEGAAQAVLAAVFVSLMELKPRKWTLRDAMLALTDTDDLQRIMAATDSAVNRAALKTFFNKSDPRLGANIGAGLNEKARHFWAIAARWDHQAKLGRTLSIKKWLRERSILVFANSHRAEGAIANLHSAFFQRKSQLILDLPNKPGRQIVVVLDELASAGRLTGPSGAGGLPSLAAQGRERGVVIIQGAQQIAPLRVLYGDNGAEAILALSSWVGGLHVPDAASSRWLQDRLGERDHWEAVDSYSSTSSSRGGSTSNSRSWQSRRDPAVLASDFQALPLVNASTGTGPSGYFLAPDIGAYRYDMTFQELVRLTPKPVEGGPEETDGRLDRLAPWSAGERRALGLPPAKPGSRKTAETEFGELDLR